jgi:hypothetical protein
MPRQTSLSRLHASSVCVLKTSLFGTLENIQLRNRTINRMGAWLWQGFWKGPRRWRILFFPSGNGSCSRKP